jgi:AcrR family transcriptional regulator
MLKFLMKDGFMLPLRERNKQRTRDNILVAAFALFEEKGYDQTTMDMIAEKAEVSRATLFNYFPAKNSLLLVFTQEILQTQIVPRVMDYLPTAPTVFDALRFFFMSLYEQMLTAHNLGRAIKQEIFLQPPPQSMPPEVDETSFINLIMVILADGAAKDDLRTDIPLDKQVNYIAALCGSLFYGLVFPLSAADYQHELDLLLLFISDGLKFQAQT